MLRLRAPEGMADSLVLPKVAEVDSSNKLEGFLSELRELDMDPVPLFVEFKGRDISRDGSLSIISIYVRPLNKIYLINIHSIGMDGTSYTEDFRGTTLQSIFQCSVLRKAFFDVRGASNILFHNHGFTLDGIVDIQLMELATRNGSREFLRGLATCVRNDSPLSVEEKKRWEEYDEFRRHIFSPEITSDSDFAKLWTKSPISTEIKDHCVCSLVALSRLYDVYDERLKQGATKFWKTEICSATETRINDSKQEDFDVHDRENAYGPWDEEELKMKMERRDGCPRGLTRSDRE
ncbi:hypothetical protein TMEN_5638 [Trichophyton mentagrophytes]|uniref:3'-5' exonuclease domain-containing protein n=1 Tax=Trichophyton interdigitale (strain MR816) TaxID=1215338 RepID=A0A059IXA0_TRIIM|nr:hypothetical protein H101_01170 [Trichophyton interdigitale H6]KDB20149.1 hypothetical protein H109_07898 [Trichophyton interdigitale MR816]GBF63017.1 hypothetical protein TMEN_5638 [Trichophyton mentagrophytes]